MSQKCSGDKHICSLAFKVSERILKPSDSRSSKVSSAIFLWERVGVR